MSSIETRSTESRTKLFELPEFELVYLLDDSVNPNEITIYPKKCGDITTHWLTIDAGHAVSLDTIA